MKRSSLMFLVFGLSACSSASAPAGPPPSLVTPTMLQPPPIYALIGYRDRLELSSDQIEQLDSIAVDLEEHNEELIDELEERSTLTRSQTALVVGEEGKPILEQIRDNNREATEAVGRMLTSDQQESICDLFSLDERGRRSERRPRMRGADPEAADSIWRTLESRTWPFCGSTDAAATLQGR